MAEPDDPDLLPTQSWAGPGDVPAIPASDSRTPRNPSPRRGGWQPPTREELQPSFPQYELRRIIGRGGMGAVYQGWQKNLERLVAIKILPPEIEDGAANFAERFKREAKAMARFTHPNIVSVYDAGETSEGLPYFVMEYIEGTDVQNLVTTQGHLSPEHALSITTNVCEALAYAHKRGVIHRDIKPSNVMVDAEGQVKVADFGLAKVLTDDSTAPVTGSHVSMGTPDFMAPETTMGIGNVDHRADLYAVGVMLYQMLTGQIPRGRFQPPSRRIPGLDVRFDAIVDHALQSDPDQRYSSATEIRTDLDRIRTEPVPEVAAASLAVSPERGGKPLRATSDDPPDQPVPAKPKTRLSSSQPLPVSIWIASGVAGVMMLVVGFIFATGERKANRGGSNRNAKNTAAVTTPADATKDAPFINSLGQEFVPVPGTNVLFCRWDTRLSDWQAFILDEGDAEQRGIYGLDEQEVKWVLKKDRSWKNPGFPQTGEHPVVGVSWEDAHRFCAWLHKKDGRTYRLPTDAEWTAAVGLQRYPWGNAWPPPKGAGNYCGNESRLDTDASGPSAWTPIAGYKDGFPRTSPVGSFKANRYGLYDMGGNVWQWCEDEYRPSMNDTDLPEKIPAVTKEKNDDGKPQWVVRGGSWCDYVPFYLRSACRRSANPAPRNDNYGFRCVLVVSGS